MTEPSLLGRSPAQMLSQIVHRVFGPMHPARARIVLDYHGPPHPPRPDD